MFFPYVLINLFWVSFSFVNMLRNGRIIWASKAYSSTDLRRRTAKTCFALGPRCLTTGSKAENRWTAGTKKSNFIRSAVNQLPWNQVTIRAFVEQMQLSRTECVLKIYSRYIRFKMLTLTAAAAAVCKFLRAYSTRRWSRFLYCGLPGES